MTERPVVVAPLRRSRSTSAPSRSDARVRSRLCRTRRSTSRSAHAIDVAQTDALDAPPSPSSTLARATDATEGIARCAARATNVTRC
jgi:hypothetical protein